MDVQSQEIVHLGRTPWLFTHPDHVAYNLTGYEDICPTGFVVPDNPSDPDIEWVNGTNCAVACISPVTNRETFSDGQAMVTLFGYLGFFGLMFLLLTYKVSSKEMHYLTYYNVKFALGATIFTIFQSFQTVEDRFCRDNANAISNRDGFVLCNVQATVAIYVSMGVVVCWAAQLAHVFNLIVLQKTEAQANLLKPYYEVVIIGMPMIPTLILLCSGNIGYAKGTSSCFVNQTAENVNLDVWCFWVVDAVLGGISFVLLSAVFGKAITVIVFSGVQRRRRQSSVVLPHELASWHHSSSDDYPMSQSVGYSYSNGVSVRVGSLVQTQQLQTSVEPAVPVGSLGSVGGGCGHEPPELGGVQEREPSLATEVRPDRCSDIPCDAPDLQQSDDCEQGNIGENSEGILASSEQTVRAAEPPVTSNTVTVHWSNRVVPAVASNWSRDDSFADGSMKSNRLVSGSGFDASTGRGVRESGVREGEDFSNQMMKRVKVLAAPLAFSAVYLGMVTGGLFARFSLYVNYHHRLEVFNDWVGCIFEHFFNIYSDQLSPGQDYYDTEARQQFAYDACGTSPASGLSIGVVIWFFFCIFGYPVIISIMFMKRANLKKLCCMLCCSDISE